MNIITKSPESIIIDNNTVSQSVGLCYFDHESEELIEIDNISGMFLSINSNESLLRKMFLVTNPIDEIQVIKISTKKPDINDNVYSVKIIINEEQPSYESFNNLPSYNSFVINNPDKGKIIPTWFLIENLLPVNIIVNLDLILEYD